MMMVIMLGMGASMTPRDFLIAFRKPKGILVGLLSQFAVMPFLGYALAVLLGLPPPLAVGLILIACMPGGTTRTSSPISRKGVLALSIMMTTVSTLVAVVMVPCLLSFYGGLAGVTGIMRSRRAMWRRCWWCCWCPRSWA
jgi:predicted Na+-dependent transporter